MSKTSLRLKLAKMLLKFATVETDKAVLNYEGELVVGIEVFVEDENGEMIPAADGEYIYDNTRIIVKDGKIETIEEIKVEQDPLVEENMEEVVEPATGDAIMTIGNEIEILRTEIENMKGEIDGLKMAIEEIKKAATSTDVESEFNQTSPVKKIWEVK